MNDGRPIIWINGVSMLWFDVKSALKKTQKSLLKVLQKCSTNENVVYRRLFMYSRIYAYWRFVEKGLIRIMCQDI